jgi:arylformamidase
MILMTIHDLSLTVTPEMVTWENAEPALSLRWDTLIGTDSAANVSSLQGGSHSGTHLDAPLHFVAGGGCVPDLDLQTLIGPATVVEVFGSAQITAADLNAAVIPEGAERLLFKTDNTRRDLLHDPTFHPEYVGIAPDGARWLVARGVKLVGVDYLSVGPYGPLNVETHQTLLAADVVVVEGLVLTEVPPGTYMFAALPPKVEGAEGSPCRAVLWNE